MDFPERERENQNTTLNQNLQQGKTFFKG